MIRFDDLVAAVQGSVLEASKALAEHNLEILDRFFQKAEGDDVEARIEDALNASADISESADPEKLTRAADAIRDAAKALEQSPRNDSLVPVTVAMEYPKMTPEGPQSHVAHVPLLSLAPMTFSQIDELRLKTDLELSVVNGELQVGFPDKTGEGRQTASTSTPESANTSRSNASVEIIVRPSSPTEGMKVVTEGFNRALRAQIPG